MNFVTKAAIGMLVSLAAAQAKADSVVTCSDASVKNGPTILSYSIASTKSARLTSAVTYKSTVYGSFQVAQYAANALELLLMIDDADTNTTPVFQFAGIPLIKSNFAGVVSEYNSAGKVTKTIITKCKMQ